VPQVASADRRATWLGAATAVVAASLLTVLAASLESTVNGPGRRTVAEPLLWAVGGGLGLAIGAVAASWPTRRAGSGALAALIGAGALLVLVVAAYNNTDLRFEDQLVGTLIVVVVPAYLGAVICGAVAANVARLAGGHRRSPASGNSSAI